MNETTRLFLCRFSFFAFCVAPTAFVIGWIGFHKFTTASPRQLEHARILIADDLTKRLGLSVAIDSVAQPDYRLTSLEGVTFKDPETGALIARLGAIEMASSGDGCVMVASQVELEFHQLILLWDALHDRVLRSRAGLQQTIRLTARNANIVGGKEPFTLTDVELSIEPESTGIDAAVSFKIAGLEMSEPSRFRATRNRQISPPQTRWEFHTGGAPLPCAPLAGHIPWLAQFGPRCQMKGMFWASLSDGGWEGEMSGQLTNIDFDRLVSDQFPHKLSGEAEIVLSRATFKAGRVLDAAGSLRAGGGVVSRSLLEAAAEEDGLRLKAEPRMLNSDASLLRYRELAFGFIIDGDGLSLLGQCEQAPQGTIICDDRDALLAEPPSQVLPTVGLVRTLVPQSEAQVPATRETHALLHALAMPPVQATTRAARRPYHSLRLKK